MSNGKWYTSSGLAMRVMRSGIFGELGMRIGWMVNNNVHFYHFLCVYCHEQINYFLASILLYSQV